MISNSTARKLLLAGVLGTALGVGGAVMSVPPATADDAVCYSWSIGPNNDCNECKDGGNGRNCDMDTNDYGNRFCKSGGSHCW